QALTTAKAKAKVLSHKSNGFPGFAVSVATGTPILEQIQTRVALVLRTLCFVLRTSYLLVGAVLPAPFAGEFFRRAPSHDFIKDCLLVSVLSQQPSESLDMLPDRARAGKHDANVSGRHIDSFVQDATGDNGRIIAGMKSFEDIAPFPGFRLMRDRR